jgi:hypothetical protein
MKEDPSSKKWQDAQASVLLDEFRLATGNPAGALADAELWFASLPLQERDRVGRLMNDPKIIGWHLQTPKIM